MTLLKSLVACVDHHLCQKSLPFPHEIRSNYGSCSSIIASMLLTEGFDYNAYPPLATALYYGLYSDTNALCELSHPADKNLRDQAQYDIVITTLLKNSNLSLDEMQIAGDALQHYQYNEAYKFAIVNARPCDPNILGFISDLLLQVDKIDTCVVFCCLNRGIKLSVRSCSKNIRAVELLLYLIQSIGSGGGHAQKAGGFIPHNNLQHVTEDKLITYFFEQTIAYHNSYDIIYASDYDIDTTTMRVYKKLPVVLGYVPITNVVPSGTEICIRTLEADLNLVAKDDLYIMIGISGEVYPIQKETFFKSYQPCDKALEISSEYLPTIISKGDTTIYELLPFARGCVSTSTTSIYAKELNRSMKIFTKWDTINYMLGSKGDYIAARCDDNHDIYIIRRDIFYKTYQLLT